MKEKQRTLLIAGAVLVALLLIAFLVPQRAVERHDTGLSAEQIEATEAVIAESKETIRTFQNRNEEKKEAYLNEYTILANAYARIGDVRDARSSYREALKYTDDPTKVYLSLFELEERFENYDEAKKVLNEAVQAHPENFVLWEERIGLEKDHFGLKGEALETMMKESITATGRATGSLVTYANFLEDEKRYEEALKYWQEAAAQNPEYEAIYAEEISRVKALIGTK